MRASRCTIRSNSVMRFGWVWIGLVRGLDLGLCFFLSFFGVFVTRKEVENWRVKLWLGFIRVLEFVILEGNERKKERKAIELK